MADSDSNQPLSSSGVPASPDPGHLRASIGRLEAELAARQAETRALPSSVMRAYQALIDRQYALLDGLKASDPGSQDPGLTPATD